MSASVLLITIVSSFISYPIGTVNQVKHIGWFSTYEYVGFSGRVYINAEDVNTVSKVRVVDCQVSVTGGHANYQYYYNASPNQGKVVAVREIRNDVGSFTFIMDNLDSDYNTSLKEFWDGSLGYVRSFNKNYSDGSNSIYKQFWSAGAGNIDDYFVRQENRNLSTHLRYEEYFSAFLPDSNFDMDYHPSLVTKLPKYNLIDPVDHSKSIDRIHRAATMDGTQRNTGGLYTDSEVRALFGWAGDLQTCPKSFFDLGKTVNEETIFKSAEFSWADLAADLDGFNIARDKKDKGLIGQQMRNYYANVAYNTSYRYSHFFDNVVKDFYPDSLNWSTEKKTSSFEKIVFDRMALDLHDDGSVSDIGGLHPIKYHFLDNSNNVDSHTGRPSLSLRKELLKTFTRFILRQSGLEETIPLGK